MREREARKSSLMKQPQGQEVGSCAPDLCVVEPKKQASELGHKFLWRKADWSTADFAPNGSALCSCAAVLHLTENKAISTAWKCENVIFNPLLKELTK